MSDGLPLSPDEEARARATRRGLFGGGAARTPSPGARRYPGAGDAPESAALFRRTGESDSEGSAPSPDTSPDMSRLEPDAARGIRLVDPGAGVGRRPAF
jgi:hypothetical protein